MMPPPPRTRLPSSPPLNCDGGFAMVTAVLVSALIVAVTGALVLSLTSGGRESARQRELYEARAAGVSALEYLYAELGDDPDLFDDMLAATSPTTYDWIDLSSAAAPDTGTDGDWNQFGTGIAIEACSTRLDPCWELRLAGDATRTPVTVAVEAIVRFDCRGSGYCSVRRFQQQMRRTNESGHDWQRSDLTEVTSGAALPEVAITTTTVPVPGKVTHVAHDSATLTATTATITWDVPGSGGTPTGYHMQWKSGTEDYPTTPPHARHQETTTASYDMTGLATATTYTVRVRAVNSTVQGEWSDDYDFTTT